MSAATEGRLPLEQLYRWERERAHEVWLTQPLGGGQVRDLSWAEGMDQARRMAAYLRSFGWEPGSRIAILSKNCAWWYLAESAVWMAGHVTVPIFPSLTGDSVRHILEHAEARALFLGRLDSDDWEAMRQGIPADIEVLRLPRSARGELSAMACTDWDDIIARSQPLVGQPARGPADLATIMYTSGTTGTPKGVMHSFGNIARLIGTLVEVYGVRADDRLLSYLPTAHLADKMTAQLMSVGAGCRVFFNESIETFAADLQRARPTVFASVPRLWTKFRQGVLAKMPQEQLSAALADPQQAAAVRRKILGMLGLDATRFAVSGGAPLAADLHRWYLDLGLDLCEGYGMTENMGVCTTNRPGRGRIGTVGQPFPGVELRLSETGEILMRGPAVMMGYFKEPEKTAEAFTPDEFLRTGDLGELDADGFLRITGRAKDQFKTSKGKYVAPAPIENQLAAHPTVEVCCVTGPGFPQPFALVMLPAAEQRDAAARAELERQLDALRLAVNERLDPHERLDFLVIVSEPWTIDNGFITPTFKVKRAVIEKHYGPQFECWASLRKTVIWS